MRVLKERKNKYFGNSHRIGIKQKIIINRIYIQILNYVYIYIYIFFFWRYFVIPNDIEMKERDGR